ncbi:MAG TPA: YihY/virulence factor BrkB family protein [Bryobacteraceae bacterium]|nr:YihY/virulence factor BrkB family protein [Bryobacteraceae bacterium]
MAEATRPASHTMEGETEAIIIEPGFLARNWWFLRRAVVAAYEDNCFSIAKGAAYSFLLSLFPILTTLTALLIRANAQSVVNVIATFVQQILPPGTENVVLSRLQERAGRGISLPIASILLSLWAGSGAMISLMEGFQAAYRIPSGRPFLKQRAMSIFLVLIAAVPAVASSSLIIFGNRIEGGFIHWLGVSDISAPVEILWRIGRYAVAFATTTFVTGLLYYFGPNHRPEPQYMQRAMASRFVRVWPGALVATALWLVATAAFAGYVSHFANYNIFYGTIRTVVVLLIWLYLIACISLLGCEFNAERERVAAVAIPD